MSVAIASPCSELLDDWIIEPEAAAEIGVKPDTLAGYRKRGIGPAYSIVRRQIIYNRLNLRAWLNAGGTRIHSLDE